MVFSSISFLLYFLPIVLVLYYACSFSKTVQNYILAIVSILFYAWGEPMFVLVLMILIGINMGMAHLMRSKKEPTFQRNILYIACILNISVLIVVKYSGFLIDLIHSIFEKQFLPYPALALPIGVSFFTLRSLSYLVDVYNGKMKASSNILNMVLYISFFPNYIAGPLESYTSMEDQILHRTSTIDGVSEGLCRFTEGLLKKVLIANNLAVITDTIFDLTVWGDRTVSVPVLVAWFGAITFTLQFYIDIVAYSDMAIGLGRMFGFHFQENFRYPFLSKSIREFKDRWHITLVNWFRDYVYHPLTAKNKRKKMDIMVRAIFISCLLLGIWHGAGWMYLYWGLYFFVFILIEIFLRLDSRGGNAILRHIYVVSVVLISMVVFRTRTGEQLSLYLEYMFGLGRNAFYSPWFIMFIREFWLVYLAALILIFPTKEFVLQKMQTWQHREAFCNAGRILYIVGMPILVMFSVIVLAKGAYHPFIYFRF